MWAHVRRGMTSRTRLLTLYIDLGCYNVHMLSAGQCNLGLGLPYNPSTTARKLKRACARREMTSQNKVLKSCIGMGYYNT